MKNSEIIDHPNYYQLPCGKFLEDFIYYKGLNFNMGSALKYKWRAGYKDGETEEKDMKKAWHYCEFEAKCRGGGWTAEMIEREVDALREEAYNWCLHEEG